MTEAKGTDERLMIILDESPGSRRAVDYVARMVGCRRGFHAYLLHFFPPLPTALLEFGGAEDPHKEQELQAELHRDQQDWIASAKAPARAVLGDAINTLRQAGLFTYEIEMSCSDPLDNRDPTVVLLDRAREKRCHTIVVGHDAHGWYRRLSGASLIDRLLRHVNEFTIWIVQ
jgi:nucleotide-binding universal stress UspA family protein